MCCNARWWLAWNQGQSEIDFMPPGVSCMLLPGALP